MASAVETTQAITTEQYLELPPPGDAAVKLDLVDGEVVEVSRPTYFHNRLLTTLIVLLETYVAAHRLGEMNFDIIVILHPDEDPLAPDLVFLSNEKLSLLSGGRVRGVPDLVVEVLSPSTYADDYGRKFLAYDRRGVPWLWFIDPDALRIEEYRHTPDGFLRVQTVLRDTIFKPGIFPGVEIRLAELIVKTDPTSRGA